MKSSHTLSSIAFLAFFWAANAFAASTVWIWNGSVSNDWNLKANWTTTDIDGSVGSADTVLIAPGYSNVLYLGTPRTIAALYMESGTVLNLDGKTLNVTGTTFFHGGLADNYSNSNSYLEMDSLVVDFTAGPMVVPADVRLRIMFSGQIVFVNGIIDNAYFFEIYDDGEVFGADDQSHIMGQVRKTGDDVFTFPVGDADVYAPLSISPPTNTGHYVTVQYFNKPYPDLTVNSTLNHVSLMEYWTLEKSGPSSLDLTLSYYNPRSGEVDDLANLRLAQYNGSDWFEVGDSASGSYKTGTVSTTSPLTLSNQMMYFTLGSDNNLNPLPVRLLSFSATGVDGHVELRWSACDEGMSEAYLIEKSSDGSQWTEIGSVACIGARESAAHYRFTDQSPQPGMQYYRLKESASTHPALYSRIVPFYLNDQNAQPELNLFPLPASDYLNLLCSNPYNEELRIVVYNQQGQALLGQTHAEGNLFRLDVSTLAPGVYFLEVAGRQVYEKMRFLIR